MENKMGFFESGDYNIISGIVEKRIKELRKYKDFNDKYTRLSNVMDELEIELPEKQKEKFHEMIELVYKTEEYYFAFAYSLGVKYGNDLKKL